MKRMNRNFLLLQYCPAYRVTEVQRKAFDYAWFGKFTNGQYPSTSLQDVSIVTPNKQNDLPVIIL